MALFPAVPGIAWPGGDTPGDPGSTFTPPVLPFTVQQISGSSTYDYGFSTTEISTAAGNAIVVLAGWDTSIQGTTADIPVVNVMDSAGNAWNHIETSSASGNGSRSSAWICINAMPVSWISVSLTTFASSLAYTIIEMANMPHYLTLDVSASNSNNSASSLAVSPGNASQNGVAFSVFTAGAAGLIPPALLGWDPLSPVSSGEISPNPVQIFPYWAMMAAGNSVNTVYSTGRTVPVSGVTFSISATPVIPVQPNPNLPVLAVQAGFGFTPGDPSQEPPDWTDITSRATSSSGQIFISTSTGRQYELSVPEAGELTISLDNHDGAFTPGNVNSPYYPGVVLGVPVRVLALWGGRWYSVAFGYVERWPQEWPDLPQWGMSSLIAIDAVGVLASVSMPSALDGDMLMDSPYVLLPTNEQYSTFTNGFNGFFTAVDSQGLLAANISRVNQRAAIYVDGTAAIATPGQSTNLLGDSDSGFGTDSITAVVSAPVSGPGVVYTDVNVPDPVSPGGVTVEFWLIIPATVPVASLEPTVFQAFGFPSNYAGTRPALSVVVNNVVGGSTLTVTLADGTAITAVFNVSPSAQLIDILILPSSISIYINGALSVATALVPGQAVPWTAVAWGCPNYAYQSGGLSVGNFTVFDMAVYPYQLNSQRIISHYVTGSGGQQNVGATTRIAQILSWGRVGIPRGGQSVFNGTDDGVAMGPAYSLVGTNAMDGINQAVQSDGGMIAGTPAGGLVFTHKWGLLDRLPVAVFGDSVNPADGQIPSTQATGFDYDNTFLYNVTQTTQTDGPTTSITVTSQNFDSQHQYFTRSALSIGISTMSNLDVYDLSNWFIAKYAQPSFRVSQIIVEAAVNAANCFPDILLIQQGDVVNVIRNPMGGASFSLVTTVQKISHEIGPGTWQSTFQLSPYQLENAVLRLGSIGYDVLGSNALA